MKIRRFEELTKEELNNLLNRKFRENPEIESIVRKIIEDVRSNGDEALIRITKELDKCDLRKVGFYVSESEFNEAEAKLSDDIKEVLNMSIENVRSFHLAQLSTDIWLQSFKNGIIAGEKITPIDSVGLYVPRGKGTFPSVAIMLCVPATIAKVEKIIVATPPDPNGKVDPSVLYVCKKLGIKKVLRLGGAQAIAALTFGTESIEKVSKIIGPGSLYVTLAKQLLSKYIDIGIVAGPSEAVVIADEYQIPRNVALDLMNEAEHGPDSISLLLTNSYDFALKVKEEVINYLEKIDEPRKSYIKEVLNGLGGSIVFKSLEDAISFCNEFAPEHLVLNVKDPFNLLPKIKNAGEILIGPNTPISAANYIAGPNSILPTLGFAKSMSALSVRDFQKRSSIIFLSAEGLKYYRDYIEKFAKNEGFIAHALSATERIIIEDLKLDDEGFKMLYLSDKSVTLIRKTRESQVIVSINKGERDPELKKKIRTPLNFLNHMIEIIAWYSGFNIAVDVSLEGGYSLMHVVTEDTGIAIGRTFLKLVQINIPKGINGNGYGFGILDEAEASVFVSFEGRPMFKFRYLANEKFEKVEDMLSKDLENFLSGFSNGAKCTLHATVIDGKDPHHIWESVFRALGEAIRNCFKRNEYRKGTTPGVKGI
jgi:histidinol dehydrogenase